MTRNSFIATAMAASLLLLAAGSANAQSSIQFSDMHDFNTGAVLAGAGSLTRSENQVSAQLSLSGLDKKAAYTMWWVFFNNPGDCATLPCGLGDLGNPGVAASVARAGGFITGTDGTANVTAHLDASDIPDGNQVLFGPALIPGNGFDAEIHVLVRSHGFAIAGATAGQIGTVGGSCDVNTCEDQQAVIFLPAP